MKKLILICAFIGLISIAYGQTDEDGYNLKLDESNGVWALKLTSLLSSIPSSYQLKFKEEYNDYKVYTIENKNARSYGQTPIYTELFFYHDSLAKIELELNNSSHLLLGVIEEKYGQGHYKSDHSEDISFTWIGRKVFAEYIKTLDGSVFIERATFYDRNLLTEYNKDQEQYHLNDSKF